MTDAPDPVEGKVSRARLAAHSGTPMGVAVITGLAFVFLVAVRSGFRGSIPQ